MSTPDAGPNALTEPSSPTDLAPLADLMRGLRTVVLAGAGCSTESGIPDYRGPRGRLRERKPMQYGAFVGSAAERRRYWARSAIGWSRISSARPNGSHHGIARLEREGWVNGVITQNVDGLHQAAGSERVVELHGSLDGVVCLDCGDRSSRGSVQGRVREVNEEWFATMAEASGPAAGAAPDGDAEVADWAYEGFTVPGCQRCDGVLKPDVVFFGENVPKDRVERAWELVDAADVLLVLGSSLTVYSGRRFVYGAVEREMPIGVVNIGPTRADEAARVKVDGRLGWVVPALVEYLAGG